MDENEEKLIFDIAKMRRSFNLCYFIALTSFVLLGLSLLECMRPVDEKPEIWFQRGGSIMVIAAVFLEVKLLSIWNGLVPSGVFGSPNMGKLRRLFLSEYKFLNKVLILQLFIGTLIWGYGDLIFKLLLR